MGSAPEDWPIKEAAGVLSVPAEPYSWPLLGPVGTDRAALIVIDMQVDFVSDGGWFSSTGFDLGLIQRVVPTVSRVLGAARRAGLHVLHTRQGSRTVAELPLVRRQRADRFGVPYGQPGPYGRGLIQGERGWDFIEEARPLPGETVFEKPAYSAFHGTDLEAWLRERGIEALILAGVTVNVCVFSTMLAAADLGFDCVVVGDATAGVTEATTGTVLDMVRYQGGIFGAVTSAEELIGALDSLDARTG